MKSNPKLAQRMNDAKKLLESNPIEILTSPSDKCPYKKCDGSGWIWKKDWSKRHLTNVKDEWQEECDCYEQLAKQREIDKKLHLAKIPPIFHNATVNSFDIGKYKSPENKEIAEIAKKAAANYILNFPVMKEHGKGLYLYSKIKGSGKTRLVSSIVNALVKTHGIEVAFLKADDLLGEIRKTFSDNSETNEAEIVKIFRQVEVLVIDDIAVEKKNSQFAERIFFNVLDYRLEHSKITLFTSNLTIDDLNTIYPEGRITSRVKKMALEIYMPEEKVREQEAEKENEELEKILFE